MCQKVWSPKLKVSNTYMDLQTSTQAFCWSNSRKTAQKTGTGTHHQPPCLSCLTANDLIKHLASFQVSLSLICFLFINVKWYVLSVPAFQFSIGSSTSLKIICISATRGFTGTIRYLRHHYSHRELASEHAIPFFHWKMGGYQYKSISPKHLCLLLVWGENHLVLDVLPQL